MEFQFISSFSPSLEQEKSTNSLYHALIDHHQYQTFMGVTGSGKTFTMGQVIQKYQKPTLVLSPNKTLAAQLYHEFKSFFPYNAVEYFVSYYDYYQPEAYVVSKDLYIEKDASINEDIERMRQATTNALSSRSDVIVVATVSAIYGLNDPKLYKKMSLTISIGESNRDLLIHELILRQYERNDYELKRGTFRVKGDIIDIWPSYLEQIYRVSFDFNQIISIRLLDKLNFNVLYEVKILNLYPAKLFSMPEENLKQGLVSIRQELDSYYHNLIQSEKILEAERIKVRTENDLIMLEEMGYCAGIENYSRHFTNRKKGERPYTLLDYFPDGYLTFLDESHVLLSQLKAMYKGDYARKTNLIEYGYRLPSAFDNRPLRYDEFNQISQQTIFVSATPGPEEMEKSSYHVEQIIRPTGLLDPVIDVRSTEGQIDNIYQEIITRSLNNQAILITTLTKKMAEHLSEYLNEKNINTEYLHSEINIFERVKIIQKLRNHEISVIVGVNLLREGLDIPEVSLIIILDADKIGFLRSRTSLIQTIGRAARHIEGKVIMYADAYSSAMQEAIEETNRRRNLQLEHNQRYQITPKSIYKEKEVSLEASSTIESVLDDNFSLSDLDEKIPELSSKERKKCIQKLTKQMKEYSHNYEFEKAITLRDYIKKLEGLSL